MRAECFGGASPQPNTVLVRRTLVAGRPFEGGAQYHAPGCGRQVKIPLEPTMARGVGVRQGTIVALVLLVLVIDGIDIQLLSLVTPGILAQWHVGRAAFGPALAGALIGMALGASLGGALGDRFGRKRLLLASTMGFALATLAASFSTGVWEMAAWRIVSGLGFGAAAPNGIALASEWLPLSARPKAVSLLSIGTPLGGMLGAAALMGLLPAYGWRACFVICGLTALAIVGVIAMMLPESASFLAGRGEHARADGLRRKILGAVPPMTMAKTSFETITTARIFTRANLRFNVGAWVGFLGIAYASYAIVSWSPVYLTMSGFTLERALGATFSFNLCAVTAAVVAGPVLACVGSRVLLVGCLIATLACVLGIDFTLQHVHGAVPTRTVLSVFTTSGGAGAFLGAATAAIYTLMTAGYPAAVRSTGLGIGLMMGRAGGAASTYVGGALLSVQGSSVWVFFAALSGALLLSLGATVLVDRHLPARGRVA